MTTLIYHDAPTNVKQLLERCDALAGMTIEELAQICNCPLPKSLTGNKGLIGQLVECFLGASAKNLSEPDFPNLGIELKTIPLNNKNLPAESTYVCTAPYSIAASLETWDNSRVKKKLSQVLWVPVESDVNITLSNRRIGNPTLWKLTNSVAAILKRDWEELTDMLFSGQANMLTANYGKYLQIRPKAASSKITGNYINESGETTAIVPKGFYLRTSFTSNILAQLYI